MPELKTKHGSALQFTLISEKEDVGAVEDAGEFTPLLIVLMNVDGSISSDFRFA